MMWPKFRCKSKRRSSEKQRDGIIGWHPMTGLKARGIDVWSQKQPWPSTFRSCDVNFYHSSTFCRSWIYPFRKTPARNLKIQSLRCFSWRKSRLEFDGRRWGLEDWRNWKKGGKKAARLVTVCLMNLLKWGLSPSYRTAEIWQQTWRLDKIRLGWEWEMMEPFFRWVKGKENFNQRAEILPNNLVKRTQDLKFRPKLWLWIPVHYLFH